MRPELLALAAKLSARDESFALVTVVRREPPSSARVGDAALVTASGEYHGWAGGGCTRDAVLRGERSPDARARGAHVLIATMGDEDLELLQKVLASDPAYVGVVASRKRFEHVRETLAACGVQRAALERVFAPAGLDLGARTPEE